MNELSSITDKSTSAPALSPVFQNVVNADYWASTTYMLNPNLAWNVGFNTGHDYSDTKTVNYYVRCVR